MSAGTCRYCRCTEDNACRLPDGEPCSWLVATQDVCNSPSCIREHQAALAKAQAARSRRPRRLNSAEIHQLKMAELAARRRRWREAAKARKKGRTA